MRGREGEGKGEGEGEGEGEGGAITFSQLKAVSDILY